MRRPIESALRAVVGMQNRGEGTVAALGLAADDGHTERVEDEFGAHVVRDRPAATTRAALGEPAFKAALADANQNRRSRFAA